MTNHRVCESEMSQRLYQSPGQSVSGDVAYLGRGCPGSKLTGTPDKADDQYVEDPRNKIALLDSGGNRDPRLSVAPNGRVDVVFYDDRLDPTNHVVADPAKGLLYDIEYAN